MRRLVQLTALLLLAGAAGYGQPAGPATAGPNQGLGATEAAARPATRVVVGYFLRTTAIEFVDGSKRPAVVVLRVRDDGNLDLTEVAYVLADDAFVIAERWAIQRLKWGEIERGTRLHLYCTAARDGAYGPPVLKVGVPAAHGPDRRRQDNTWQVCEDRFMSEAPKVKSVLFDRIRSPMTLGELVDLLGRGSRPTWASGTGIIRWPSDDGREFWVWPIGEARDAVVAVDGGKNGIGTMGMTRVKDGRTETVPIPAKGTGEDKTPSKK